MQQIHDRKGDPSYSKKSFHLMFVLNWCFPDYKGQLEYEKNWGSGIEPKQ